MKAKYLLAVFILALVSVAFMPDDSNAQRMRGSRGSSRSGFSGRNFGNSGKINGGNINRNPGSNRTYKNSGNKGMNTNDVRRDGNRGNKGVNTNDVKRDGKVGNRNEGSKDQVRDRENRVDRDGNRFEGDKGNRFDGERNNYFDNDLNIYHGYHYSGYMPYYYHPYTPYGWGPYWYPFGIFVTFLSASAIAALYTVGNINCVICITKATYFFQERNFGNIDATHTLYAFNNYR